MGRASIIESVGILAVLGVPACAAGVDARTTCPASPCLEGYACDDASHTCVRSCTPAGGCLDSERCDIPYGKRTGLCTPSTYCADDSVCAEGWVCTSAAPRICLRACTSAGGCRDDESCDLPDGSDAGVCRPRPYCSGDSLCEGRVCDELTHLCRSTCTGAAACASTETCDLAAGVCRLVVTCGANDSICGDLATCDLPGGAEQGVCLPTTP
jgi:hypothetical protein